MTFSLFIQKIHGIKSITSINYLTDQKSNSFVLHFRLSKQTRNNLVQVYSQERPLMRSYNNFLSIQILSSQGVCNHL